MTTMVLVHGAWGGSYGFRSVRPLLWEAGHPVFTPSLTGIGERSHLTSSQVTLGTHIQDVVNTVLYEDLTDIVLLGFSYGGMVVTGALDHIGDRVSHLVYLDALLPANGQSALDVIGAPPGPPAAALGDDWLIPPLPRQLDDPAAQAWQQARRSGQPARTFRDPVSVSKPIESFDLTRTFIKASADPQEANDSAFWQAAHMARDSADWAYHEIETHHLVPFSHPRELSDILIDTAS